MARLRRSDCSLPGIVRTRRGRGFSYTSADTGLPVDDPEILQRIKDLVLPPAWRDVWICPWPNGHLQAVGVDAAGRKQYRYHDAWRTRRDSAKFDEMLEFARVLPALRAAMADSLQGTGLGRERVLACAVRLLDYGFFRVGSEVGRSGDQDTFGLTTMRKEHVRIDGDVVWFEYDAKGGKHQVQGVVDPTVREIVTSLKRRRSGGGELLACKQGRVWFDVTAAHVNEWIQEQTGGAHSAKSFRTWHATVLAAKALAVSGLVRKSATGVKRAEARAAREVADYLGNTPAVARSSYIDPRVFDRYRSGWTIAVELESVSAAAPGIPAIHAEDEAAVIDLLEHRRDSDAVDKADRLAS